MDEKEAAAKATGIVLFWGFLMVAGVFIALFKRPKLMIPILVIGLSIAPLLEEMGLAVIGGIIAAGFVLARN